MTKIKMNPNEDFRWFLREDCRSLGELFEYAAHIKKVDMNDFVSKFMDSGIREWMDSYHPIYTNLLSAELYDEFEKYCKEFNIQEVKKMNGGKQYAYRYNELLWVGWWYAYLHYLLNMPSKELVKILPFEIADRYYSIGHEIDFIAITERFISEYNTYVEEQNNKEAEKNGSNANSTGS